MNDSTDSLREDGEQLLRLLDDARQGKLTSDDELYRQMRVYFEQLVQFELGWEVRRKVGHSDVVQEACVSAIRGIDQFQGKTEGELRAWLKTLLTNEVNQVVRGLHRQKRDVRREKPIDGDSMLGIHASQPADPRVTPGTDAIQREQHEAIVSAMERLPEHYRTVLQLRLWQRKSYQEIADQIGKTVAATEKLWFRAIQKMKEELDS